jgi:hypothetical protein
LVDQVDEVGQGVADVFEFVVEGTRRGQTQKIKIN